MRSVFGILSLLVVLAIVGLIAKKQLDASRQPAAVLAVPDAAATGDAAGKPTATVKAQSEQIQQQYKQALDNAMQQPRALPDGE
jgi:predicted lipid-binding transport protein (Tim44 family)